MEIVLKVKSLCQLYVTAFLGFAVSCSAPSAWAAPVATTTTLTIYSGANTAVSGGSVDSGTVVLLAATVKAGTAGVSPGLVSFCDASVASCSDIHLLGRAQLFKTDRSAGTAYFAFRPGIGIHTYKAVFAGTPNGATAYASSTSNDVTLTVNGLLPTKTSISGTGNPGNYSLTAIVTGLANATGSAAPSGTVLFPDTSNGNVSIASAPLGTGTEAFSFQNSSNPDTGISPSSVAAADLNNDGLPDLVTADSGSNSLSVLLGNGDGSFRAAAHSPVSTGHNPSFVTIGDFNSDNNTDLAVANYADGTVTILLGNGDGTFAQAANSLVSVGRGPLSIAVGDFSGDGVADLAVANAVDDTVTILLGNGNATFFPAAPIPVSGSSPASVAVADFNGDGNLDLVVAVVGPNDVAIFLGNGNGTFTEAANSPVRVGLTPYSVAVGDFNEDGIPDLVTANDASVDGDPGTATILLGSRDGSFTEASGSPIPVGINPLIVAVGDFNADGKVDLAVSNENDNTVAVLLGNADGTFTQGPPARTSAGQFPLSVAAADFNADGLTDLAVTNTDLMSSTSAMVLLAQITETATATANGVAVTGAGTHIVAAAYSGNTIYDTSTSQTTVGLTEGPAPGFTVGGTAVTIVAGAVSGNTSAITITPSGGFTGNVVLTAAITSSPADAQNPPTLSFGSTSPVTITSIAAGTATLTISTTAAATASLAYPDRREKSSWHAAGGAILACVLLFGIPARRRGWRTTLGAILLSAFLACGVSACGGGGGTGSRGGGTGSSHPGTTPGTYIVTITGTAGATIANGTVTLKVQ